MAKATLTFTDVEQVDGSIRININFEPAIKFNELTPAQYAAFEAMENLCHCPDRLDKESSTHD